MPAHDIPYFEPAGGQNAEASSVVKAFGLARSRETARRWHAATGRAPPAGRRAPPEAPARCLAAGSGAARVRRWWQVARLPTPGPPDVTCAFTAKAGPGRRPLSCRHGLAGVARWAASSPVRAAVSPHRHL